MGTVRCPAPRSYFESCDLGRVQELRCPDDPQALLRSLIDKTKVLQFEIAQPSLHDIFLRIAGPQAGEVAA